MHLVIETRVSNETKVLVIQQKHQNQACMHVTIQAIDCNNDNKKENNSCK